MATSNTAGGSKLLYTPWTTDRQKRLPAAVPAVPTIYYAGQAVLRDASGNLIQCDDTQKGDFVGILIDMVRTQVDPTDAVQVNGLRGDKSFDLVQPQAFTAEIAVATAGDEGRKVYWLYNTTVSYSPGASGNLAGMVDHVKDSTHVLVVPPWMLPDLTGSKAILTLSGTAPTITLSKFDIGKTLLLPSSVTQAVTLPAASKCGSGDQVIFVQTGSNASGVTITAAGSDTINSTTAFAATTLALGTAQGSRAVLQTDGSSKWFVVG